MPVPDRPVLVVGESREGFARVDGVRMTYRGEQVTIEERVGIGVRFAQVEASVLRERLQGASLGRSREGFALEMAGPSAAFFSEPRGADPRLNAQTAGFQFALKSSGSKARERLERTGEKNDLVFLLGVPSDAGETFREKSDGIEVTVEERSADVGQVTLVGVLDGEEAAREESESVGGPAEIIRKRNFVVVAEFAEEAAFEGRFGEECAVEIEDGGDAAAGLGRVASEDEGVW